MLRLSHSPGAWLLVCASGALPAWAAETAPAPWEIAQPFSLSPQALRSAASIMPVRPEYPCSMLLEEEATTLDEAGRRQTRYHRIYRVEKASGIGNWGNVDVVWNAWLEEKPRLRARVITPDGVEWPLDPATIGEFQSQQQDADVFSDQKELKGPLPRLVDGSLVEVEILRQEFRPFSKSGIRSSFFFASPIPVHCYRFSLDAPASQHLKWKVEEISQDLLKHTISGGRSLHFMRAGPTLPPPPQEPYEDPEQIKWPLVKYSSTPGWGAAAAEYAEILQAQLKDTDLKDVARQAKGQAKERKAIIEAVLAHVQQHVRYVGLEFGEASIVPRTPNEVLKRGYGDCKDKSTLVVALLQALGIEARVALLRVGSPWDIDPEMPGLSMFDHAIVYVPGSSPLWIDPAARHARAGQLPMADQNRQALIIAKDTKDLIKTPLASAKENLTRRTLNVHMAQDGPARILETTEIRGTEEISWRSHYSSADPQQTKEALKRHVVQTYNAKDLGTYHLSGTEDFSRPFDLAIEATDASIATTASKEAIVSMNPWPLVNDFDEIMQPPRNQGSKDSTSRPGSDEAGRSAVTGGGDLPRKKDLFIQEPYSIEHRWIIHPPDGYVNESLPENRTFTFGSATLSYTYAKGERNAVEATFRFDCAQRLWTAREVMDVRKALKIFGSGKVPLILFQQQGEAYLRAGRFKEALAEFRRSVEASPLDIPALLRLARGQLSAGLAQGARQTAQRAVQLKPEDPSAWSTLAWILQHDALGRRFKGEWNRPEALKAYRKAIELEPGNRFHRWNLAVLLEHDVCGIRYNSAKDLEAAAELYKTMLEEEPAEPLESNYVQLLAHLGRFEEARRIADAYRGKDGWDGWVVTTAICSKGFQAALPEVVQAYQNIDSRRQALLSAADNLVALRRYAEASQALIEGSAGSEKQAQLRARAERLAKIQRHNPILVPGKDPRDLPFVFLFRLFEDRPTLPRLQELFARAQQASLDPDELLQIHRRLLEQPVFEDMRPSVVMDIIRSQSEVTFEGDDLKGYRIQLQGPNYQQTFGVTREEGVYRLVSVYADEAAWARQARWSLEHQDSAGASAWLDRAQDRCWKGTTQDPFWDHPIFSIRTKGKTNPASLKLGVASVLAYHKPDEAALNVLQEAHRLTLAKSMHDAIAMALANVQARRNHWEASEAIARELQAKNPFSSTLKYLRGNTLAALRRWRELLEYADSELRANPEEDHFLRAKRKALMHLRRFKEAEALLQSQIAKGKMTAEGYKEYAWAQVEEGQVSATTLEWIRKAIQMNEERSLESEQTLALVLTELGRTAEARETLIKAKELSVSSRPTPQDLFTMGRIAEQLGESELAREFYANVKSPSYVTYAESLACIPMAQARLRVLQAGPASR